MAVSVVNHINGKISTAEEISLTNESVYRIINEAVNVRLSAKEQEDGMQ
jgi:hypothetical protein